MPQSKRSCRIHAIAALLAAASAAPIANAADPAPFVTLQNCNEQNVFLIYPSLLYRKLLPPGFSFQGRGLTAQIEVGGAYCASADGGGPTSNLLSFMQVVPPARYADPSISFYGIALNSFSDRPETVAGFAAAGFGDSIHLGAVTITTVEHPLLHEIRGRVVAGNDDASVVTNTVVFGPTAPIPAARTRLFAVRDGAVVGIADGVYTTHAGYTGIGTLLKAGDGPMVAPIAASIGTHEIGFDLAIVPVPLPP